MNLKSMLLVYGIGFQYPLYAHSVADCNTEKNTEIMAKSASMLLPCFASPLPEIRDEYAFTKFSQILRSEDSQDLNKRELVSMTMDIQKQLRDPDIRNFHKSFLTLGLAEIVRVDRKAPFFNDVQRNMVIDTAAYLFESTTDFTGFDDKHGYIHQIPHTADLVLQLALNENISKLQLLTLAQSLKTVVNPNQIVFYHTNEPDRLARATLYLFLREEFSDDFITQWLEDVSVPLTSTWEQSYQSTEGLAAMHNVKSFLGRLLLITYNKQNKRIAHVHERTLAELKRVQ